ncbi:hypothetical protein [Kribbella sp. NPDC048915]|uniref:hypothetical protein n=1 Tax=Kribbella sp. NPDC048915 TaxID=3155148 RepID=UPI0033CE9620
MSSIVPGPQKKLEEEITAARAGAKPLDARDLNPSAPRHEALTGLDDWPESLRSAVETEYTRVAALDSNRRKTADLAVPGLVTALDTLLEGVADRIQAGKPRLFGRASAGEASPEAAGILGIPSDELEAVSGRGEHRTALRTIKQLRSQLKELADTPDHARLTRLTTFVIRLAVVVDADPQTATALAPIALVRFAESAVDPQRSATFAEKLDSWIHARATLGSD